MGKSRWLMVALAQLTVACSPSGSSDKEPFTPGAPASVSDDEGSSADGGPPLNPDLDVDGVNDGDPGGSQGGDGGQQGDDGDQQGGDQGAGPDVDPSCTLDCDGHGRCVSDGARPMCLCDPGYAAFASPTNCRPAAGTACDGYGCGGGTCMVHVFGGAGCACPDGLLTYRDRCVEESKLACRNRDGTLAQRSTTRCSADDGHIEVCHDGNGDGRMEWIFGAACADGGPCSRCIGRPCPEQPCPVGTACVEEAHEQPLGVCVAICDCSNCSNCGPDNTDGRWNDWQEACGAPGSSTPTSSCRLPCPSAGDGCIPYSPSICWPMEGCFSGAP